MRARILAVGLLLIVGCTGVSEDCAHAAARWNATLGPYSDHGLDPGVVLPVTQFDVVKHENAVVRRQELTARYPICFEESERLVAEEQFAELQGLSG